MSLILSRRSGESIIIGGSVVFTVRSIRSYGALVEVTGIQQPIRKSMHIGESLEIPEVETEVTLLTQRGAQVRIGVNAPKEVPVNREEIQRRIEAERMTA